MIVLPAAFTDWARYEGRPDAERRAYVSEELRRLDRMGAPVLTIVAACLDDRNQQIAIERLKSNDDGEGTPILEHRAGWLLRLVPDAEPPRSDPQGRPLPPELAGKVLVAKVGTLGNQLGPEAEAREVQQWGAEAREARDRQGRDLYRCVKITREGITLDLADALAVLRQWGVGVARRQRRRPDSWRQGSRDDGTGQANWLVEEVNPRAGSTSPKTDKSSRSASAGA